MPKNISTVPKLTHKRLNQTTQPSQVPENIPTVHTLTHKLPNQTTHKRLNLKCRKTSQRYPNWYKNAEKHPNGTQIKQTLRVSSAAKHLNGTQIKQTLRISSAEKHPKSIRMNTQAVQSNNGTISSAEKHPNGTQINTQA